MPNVLVTKQGAAQRQLDAGIRMLFLHGEDMTAVHTVVSAARQILADLAEARGVGHTHGTRLALERLYSEHYGLDPTAPSVADEINRRARAIERDRVKDGNRYVNRTKEHRNRSANYLKHADIDPNDYLDLNELNPCGVIIDALILWDNLKLDITPEIWAFSAWWAVVTGSRPVNSERGPVHQWSFDQQIAYGCELLKLAYVAEGRSLTSFRDDAAHEFEHIGAVRMYRPLETSDK